MLNNFKSILFQFFSNEGYKTHQLRISQVRFLRKYHIYQELVFIFIFESIRKNIIRIFRPKVVRNSRRMIDKLFPGVALK